MRPKTYRLQYPDLATYLPRVPREVEDLGLPTGLVQDLVLRALFISGTVQGLEIGRMLNLPFNGVVEHLLDGFIREKMVDFKGGGGFGRAYFEYILTDKGRQNAREAMERCTYVGPAPVPLEQYVALVRKQMRELPRVTRDEMRKTFHDLVLDDALIDRLGPAVNSMRSLFLYGAPGNGKTSIAERIAYLMRGEIFVPHALAVDNQIIQVFDNMVHKEVLPLPEDDRGNPIVSDEDALETTDGIPGTVVALPAFDARWVLCQRPYIITGGELTLDMLDLSWDPGSRIYQAPFQVKSCQGMLLIDDFGRQKVHPTDLLNRWIVPLEKRIDYLSLKTGKKFDVPFDLLIIFSTNIDPAKLVDAAFLRRIRYKIEVKDPTEPLFADIFRAECERQGIRMREDAIEYILGMYYRRTGRALRCCHPRDILQLVCDLSRFLGAAPVLDKRLIDHACQSYFVHMEGDGATSRGNPLPPRPAAIPNSQFAPRPAEGSQQRQAAPQSGGGPQGPRGGT